MILNFQYDALMLVALRFCLWCLELTAAEGSLLLCFSTLGLFLFYLKGFVQSHLFYADCNFIIFIFDWNFSNEMNILAHPMFLFSFDLPWMEYNPNQDKILAHLSSQSEIMGISLFKERLLQLYKMMIPYKLVCAGCSMCDKESLLYQQDCMSAFCQQLI